jgi:hypothetical protein
MAKTTGDDTGPEVQVIHSFIWVRLLVIGMSLTLGGFFGSLPFLVGIPLSPGHLAVPAVAYIPVAIIAGGLVFLGWAAWMRRHYPDRRSWSR